MRRHAAKAPGTTIPQREMTTRRIDSYLTVFDSHEPVEGAGRWAGAGSPPWSARFPPPWNLTVPGVFHFRGLGYRQPIYSGPS